VTADCKNAAKFLPIAVTMTLPVVGNVSDAASIANGESNKCWEEENKDVKRAPKFEITIEFMRENP
jgi:hypothetical protein